MQLKPAIDWLVYSLIGLEPGKPFAEILDFFLYDYVKILFLLFCMIFIIGVLRTFLPRERLRAFLSGHSGWSYAAASMFGAVTPFCSCSSIPIFMGFLSAGVPLGVSFAFLITSPLINEYLVVLMLGFFGPLITLLYVLTGLALGISCGFLIGRMKMEGYLVPDMQGSIDDEANGTMPTLSARMRFGLEEARSIISKIGLWVLVGVGLGAFIHNMVPSEAIQSVSARAGVWSVPIATILGVPMYGSSAAIVPIAVALFQKGMPLGTALSFMMAISALSLPEAVMLRRAMRLPLILVFFSITAFGIILIGYLFNGLSNLGFVR